MPATARRFADRLGQEPGLDNLRGARIAVVAETQQHLYLKQLAEAQELSVLPAATMAEMFTLLREAKVDFSLLPMLSAYAMLNREPPGAFEFVGPPLVDAGLGGTVHIALPKTDDALRRNVNQALVAMRGDGSYHRIVRRYFPFSLD
jgi:ABC-type amino acid transport substrate-binding protein